MAWYLRVAAAATALLSFVGCNLHSSLENGPSEDVRTEDVADVRDMIVDAGHDSMFDVSGDDMDESTTDADAAVEDLTDHDASDTQIDPGEGWLDVSAGLHHTCALTLTNEAYCWGLGEDGRLGNGAGVSQTTPVAVLGDHSFVEISAGGQHTCAIDVDGKLFCWGNGESIGHPSLSDSAIPLDVSDNATWKTVSAGDDHTCAIDSGDVLHCWGNNESREIGLADDDSGVVALPTPVDTTWTATRDVAAGRDATCALSDSGVVYCWGRDLTYAEWDNSAPRQPVSMEVPANATFDAVTIGEEHACAHTSDGEVHCWGYAELVDEPAIREPGPDGEARAIKTPLLFSEISSGEDYTCGVTNDERVFCFGSNYRGRMGVGWDHFSPSDAFAPLQIDSTSHFRTVAAGADHGCAITSENDELYCWGQAVHGRVGNGILGYVTEPQDVMSNATYESAGAGRYHSCALGDDGTLDCWGRGTYKALGNGSEDHQSLPTPVPSIVFDSFFATASRTCGIADDDSVYCWGRNRYGELGTGSGSATATPMLVDTTETFTTLVGGYHHTCGLTSTQDLFCFGRDTRMGMDVTGDQESPVQITGHSQYASLAASESHTCGLQSNGQASCWGENADGELGDGTETASYLGPVDVLGNITFRSIAAGDHFTCGISSTDEGYCWGSHERLGSGSSTDKSEPTLISGGHSWSIIRAAEDHACGVTTTGETYCWGEGEWGRLGTGLRQDEDTPALVDVGEEVLDIAPGGQHTCAIGKSGTAYCWGIQEFGRLGDGVDTLVVTPAPVDVSNVDFSGSR